MSGKSWKEIEDEIIQLMRDDANRLRLRADKIDKAADDFERKLKERGPLPEEP